MRGFTNVTRGQGGSVSCGGVRGETWSSGIRVRAIWGKSSEVISQVELITCGWRVSGQVARRPGSCHHCAECASGGMWPVTCGACTCVSVAVVDEGRVVGRGRCGKVRSVSNTAT